MHALSPAKERLTDAEDGSAPANRESDAHSNSKSRDMRFIRISFFFGLQTYCYFC